MQPRERVQNPQQHQLSRSCPEGIGESETAAERVAGLLWEEVEHPERSDDPAEVLLSLGQALPQGTPPDLAAAAVEMIAECDPDRCFNDGLELMMAGLTASQPESRKSRATTG